MVKFNQSSLFCISLTLVALVSFENRCVTPRAIAAPRLPRALKTLPNEILVLSHATAYTATGRYLQVRS
jgi:hypothetical protein